MAADGSIMKEIMTEDFIAWLSTEEGRECVRTYDEPQESFIQENIIPIVGLTWFSSLIIYLIYNS